MKQNIKNYFNIRGIEALVGFLGPVRSLVMYTPRKLGPIILSIGAPLMIRGYSVPSFTFLTFRQIATYATQGSSFVLTLHYMQTKTLDVNVAYKGHCTAPTILNVKEVNVFFKKKTI